MGLIKQTWIETKDILKSDIDKGCHPPNNRSKKSLPHAKQEILQIQFIAPKTKNHYRPTGT